MKKLLLFFSVLASFGLSAQGPQATPLITDTTTLRNYINLEIQPNGTKAITAYKMNRILNGYLNCWPFGGTVTASQSVLKTGLNLTLLNDALAPGNNKVYGTNSSGVKGWQSANYTLHQVTNNGNTTTNSINVNNATVDSSLRYRPDTTFGWQITQREALKTSNLPVASFQPTADNTAIALDIMPKGSPSDVGANGKAWLDVCDTDIRVGQPAVGAARVGITSSAVQFGSMAFNGATAKPVQFLVNGVNRMEMLNNSTTDVNLYSRRFTQTGSPSADFVGSYVMNTENTVANSDAITFIGNDLASLRFGFLRWTNGAQTPSTYRNPNQFEVIANTGATNGLVMGAFVGPIKFVQGALGSTEAARFSPNARLLLGSQTDNGFDKLQVTGTIQSSSLVSTGTAPSTTGTLKMLVSDETGRISFDNIGSGSNIATAAQTATGNYTHNWGGYGATFDHLGYWQFIQDGGATANHDWTTRVSPTFGQYAYLQSVANGEFYTGGVHINGTDTATGANLEISDNGRTKIYGWTNTTQSTVADISKDSISFISTDVNVYGSTRMKGAVYNNVVSATDADYTVTGSDYIITLPNITSVDREIFLPSAASHTGRSLLFYNNDVTTGSHEWIFNVGVRQYGAPPLTLLQVLPPLSSIEIFSDGTNWIVKYYNH